MFKKHVSVQEFLNAYNALDNYLRDICGGDESRGMISLYKDTLKDPKEQLKLKTINKLRNELAHGVFPSDDPIKIDESLIKLLNKHLKFVSKHQKEVKEKMLIAMKNRREKDERRNASIPQKEEPVTSNFPIKKIYLSNISGMVSIEDASCFVCEFDYSTNGDILVVSDASGIGRIGLPAGQYELLSAGGISGNVMVMTHKAHFKKIERHDVSGIFHVAEY